ncbi:apolipoprotein N-acyltransferase [Meridianimarinicoccus roseus]|uniref:Apolipoprotein N-acyltransferase n=2 Tax=Meridianimarinicoccus roseus TaxID=2072018 RepID=A0A2V2LCI6_9RHOB|nr:apolipoprotein N-acyltransferase [Meridianimarinicoccus roseus]
MRVAPRLLAVAAGAAMALGHAPFGLPAATLAALAAALLLLDRAVPGAEGAGADTTCPGLRRAAFTGWACGLGYFAVTLHWIVEPFLVDIARHGWMAPFALVLMAGGLALFWAAGFAAAVWLVPASGWRRGAALAVTLTLAEMLRAVLFTGFPWGLIGSVWVDTPLRLWTAWIGPHGLGALTVLLAASLGAALRPGAPRRGVWAAGTGAAFAAALLAGTVAQRAAPTVQDAARPVIRLVQPNAAQHLKWRRDMIPVFWNRALDLTRAPAAPGAQTPALVVWPEVSLYYLLGTAPEQDAAIAAAAGGVPVIVGAQRFDGPDLRNALAVIGPGGRIGQVYDKFHLVPFGEYFPGGALAAWLGLEGLATDYLGGFTPGPGPTLIDLTAAGLGRALPLICYEVIFPRHAAAPPGGPRPDWILQITNDAWFGRFAGPQQHLAQARMRATEQGLPLVRAANTGISAMIDPVGRVTGALALGTAGALDRALPAPLPPTPFALVGNVPLLAAAALVLAGLLRARRRALGS